MKNKLNKQREFMMNSFALSLVEKFSTELVKYLKAEERKKELIKSSQISDDEENSLTVY